MEEMIRREALDDGVLTAVIDMPGRTMNVFSAELMDALEALLDHVDRSASVRSVVLTSGKRSFLAGADLKMVREFTQRARTATQDEMFRLCGRLGRLFARLEASEKPWIAAVNGTALGGGLELAMACRARMVCDDPRTLLGLPEVSLGLLPGAGGTQRLPRLIGFEPAMGLLLTGRSLDPVRAVALGVFAEAVPQADLLGKAREGARRMHGQPYDASGKFPHLAGADVPQHTEWAAQDIARAQGVSDEDFARYPAYGAIVDSVLKGARLSLAQATDIEMRQFLRLMFDPVAENMVRTLFLNRQRAERELAPPPELRVEGISHGEWSPAAEVWPQALSKSGLDCKPDRGLPQNTIELRDSKGHMHRVAVCSTVDGDGRSFAAGAVLSTSGRHGRVLEIVTVSDDAAAALACVAIRIGALPFRTRGEVSVLLRLAAAGKHSPASLLDAQATEALSLAVEGLVPDMQLFDVAACMSGVTPAYSGGPFTYLWQDRERVGAAFLAPAGAGWDAVWQRLEAAYG